VSRARPGDLRAITADGVFFSAMVGMGETYVPAFALAMGLGAVTSGLIATVPMLAGAVFQLVTPRAVRWLRSYRRWVVLCAGLQALSFVPLILGALGGRIGLGSLAVAAVAYWSFGMATSPAWNAWVTSLVPSEERARFFAHRTRAAQIALLTAMLGGGLSLEWGDQRGTPLLVFGALFALAMLARLVSATCLGRQSEAPGLASAHHALSPRGVLGSLRRSGSGRVLVYLLAMQATVNVASPYFTPYMFGPLALSYAEFMSLTAAALAARIAVMPWLGHVAQRRGTRFLLGWGAVGIVPLPLLWLVSHHFAYLLALQCFAGTAWAALEFATLLSFFEGIPEHERTSVLAVFNLANAAAVALGALCGGRILLALEGSPEAYAVLFAVSVAGRLGALGLLRGARAARGGAEMQLRTLAVRPSAGAVERPILATVDGAEHSGEAPGRETAAS